MGVSEGAEGRVSEGARGLGEASRVSEGAMGARGREEVRGERKDKVAIGGRRGLRGARS